MADHQATQPVAPQPSQSLTHPKVHPIVILGIKTDDTLELSDRGRTVARSGEIVMWIVKPLSGVETITGIVVKQGSNDVFVSPPAPVGNNKFWQGAVLVYVPTEEKYSIHYTKTNGGNGVYDPVIQANP